MPFQKPSTTTRARNSRFWMLINACGLISEAEGSEGLENIVAAEQSLDGRRGRGSRSHHDRNLVILWQVVHHHIEHESVQLRFRQGIGAFHLDGVLGGQDKKGLLQRMPYSGGGHLV